MGNEYIVFTLRNQAVVIMTDHNNLLHLVDGALELATDEDQVAILSDLRSELEHDKEQQERMRRLWNTPVDFDGQVIREAGG